LTEPVKAALVHAVTAPASVDARYSATTLADAASTPSLTSVALDLRIGRVPLVG
jgi:hypothetical protein